MVFKKSDNNQIEFVVSIIIAAILILLPVDTILEMFSVVVSGTVEISEEIVTLGGVLLFIFIIMYMIKKENFYFTWLDLFLVLELCSINLSTLFAQDPALAISGNGFNYEGTLVNVTYILIIFACSLLKNKKHRSIVWGALIIVSLFEIFMGFMQSAFKVGLFLGVPELMAEIGYRAYGTIYNQNPYGALMAIFAGAGFGLTLMLDKKVYKIIAGIFAALNGACVIFSGTRGAMVGLAFSVVFWLVYLFFYNKKKKTLSANKVRNTIIAMVFLIVGVIIAMILAQDTVNNTIDRVSEETSVTTTVDALGSGRIGLWLKVLKQWSNHPIFGIGISNLVIREFHGFDMSIAFVAHNEFIDILTCRGIFGFMTFIAMMLYIFITAIKRMWTKEGFEKAEIFGLLVAFVAYMATAFFGWRIIVLTPYFYAMVGLMSDRRSSKRIRIKKK